MKKNIDGLISKATRSISAAKELFARGDYDFAASRAYYAIFYVSEALLLTKGQSYSKQSSVLSGIYTHFIRDDELPKEFHSVLNLAFDMRSDDDYLCEVPFRREDVDNLISDIEKQVKVGIEKLRSVEV